MRGVIVCQDEEGLVFLAPAAIASLVMEGPLRCRVVSRDGLVAFRRDMPEGNWARVGEALVNPEGLVALGKRMWSDPAGFVYLGELEGTFEAESGLRALGVRSTSSGRCVWLTDEGEIEEDQSIEAAAEAHPELVLVRQGLYVNLLRLRRWDSPKDAMYDLIMDDGRVLETVSWATFQKLAERLGLASPYALEPGVPGLASYFVRDWPFELATAPGEVLRRHFASARKLIANLIYQAFRYRQLGIKRRYGRTHRGFWYRPLHSALFRAGFLNDRRYRWLEPDEVARSSDEQMCQNFGRILEAMISEERLLTFEQLGFKEVKPGNRRMGKLHPEILLLAEKESISDFGLAVHRKLGISYVETGGYPRLIAAEFLKKRLAEAGVGEEYQIVAFVDLDPDGWALVEALVAQLACYGLRLRRPPVFVITGEVLTEEEKELLTRPCPHSDSSKVKNWLEHGGGIDGRARCFYANHFEPLERVLARVKELL